MNMKPRLITLTACVLFFYPRPVFGESVPEMAGHLTAPDVKSRRAAIGGLFVQAYKTKPVIADATKTTEFSDPAVKASLLRATDDPDFGVRLGALETFAMCYKLNPDIEAKIIAAFDSPESELPHQPSSRPALVEMLMIGRSPSPLATDFISHLLDDPRWGPHIANRMAVDSCPLTDAVLDKLANKLNQGGRSRDGRADYASAIGVYGHRAQKYAPQLKKALGEEKDSVVQQSMRDALTKVQ